MDSTTSNPIEGRCGRTAPHGGHWAHAIGRPCAGNVNIVTARDAALDKSQLTERQSLVRIATITRATIIGPVTYPAGVYRVVDLMERSSYHRPDRIGIAYLDRGIAFSVTLAEIVEIVR